MDAPDRVILVDEADTPVGEADKLAAHRQGRLHRAFSVFVFGERGLLLQQRAPDKYHSAHLWSNTCCGHPRPGEHTGQAARRRLQEEMGIECDLLPVARLTYRLPVGPDLVEHELDHVLVGRFPDDPTPDPGEVAAWRWAGIPPLADDLRRQPAAYTAWFPELWTALAGAARERHPELDPLVRQYLQEIRAGPSQGIA